MWTSVFTYDPLTKRGQGNYCYENGVNPDDWGEHNLQFGNGDVRCVDRNLKPEFIESLLRAEIRRRRVNKLFAAADRLADLEMPPLTEAEVEAEIIKARQSRSRQSSVELEAI